MSKTDIVSLAIGRIFGMMQREYREGDIAEYERCRAIILDAREPSVIPWQPNYARDRNRGASGD
jgi:hypothetical protein